MLKYNDENLARKAAISTNAPDKKSKSAHTAKEGTKNVNIAVGRRDARSGGTDSRKRKRDDVRVRVHLRQHISSIYRN